MHDRIKSSAQADHCRYYKHRVPHIPPNKDARARSPVQPVKLPDLRGPLTVLRPRGLDFEALKNRLFHGLRLFIAQYFIESELPIHDLLRDTEHPVQSAPREVTHRNELDFTVGCPSPQITIACRCFRIPRCNDFDPIRSQHGGHIEQRAFQPAARPKRDTTPVRPWRWKQQCGECKQQAWQPRPAEPPLRSLHGCTHRSSSLQARIPRRAVRCPPSAPKKAAAHPRWRRPPRTLAMCRSSLLRRSTCQGMRGLCETQHSRTSAPQTMCTRNERLDTAALFQSARHKTPAHAKSIVRWIPFPQLLTLRADGAREVYWSSD